jgi:hypothetical protein
MAPNHVAGKFTPSIARREQKKALPRAHRYDFRAAAALQEKTQ